jgi:Flp pilus assembly protein TadD
LPVLLALAAASVSLLVGCSSHKQTESKPTEITKVDISASSKAVHRSAELLSDQKDKDAGELLQQAIKADPNYGPLHNNMGIVALRQGRLYEAASEFDTASRLMPTIAEPRNNLGLVLERVGRLDDAIAAYTKAHELQPDSAIYLGNLLRAKVRRGDTEREMHNLFQQLLLHETRPEWVQWAQAQMTQLDIRTRQLPGQSGPAASPTTVPATNP